jgi:hypothetical protein
MTLNPPFSAKRHAASSFGAMLPIPAEPSATSSLAWAIDSLRIGVAFEAPKLR